MSISRVLMVSTRRVPKQKNLANGQGLLSIQKYNALGPTRVVVRVILNDSADESGRVHGGNHIRTRGAGSNQPV